MNARHFLRPFVLGTGLLALLSCQTTMTPEPTFPVGPMKAYATFNVTEARMPDSAEWSSRTDSGRGGLRCEGLACTDTLWLRGALGSETAHLRIWAYGIRLATLDLTQSGGNPVLGVAYRRDTFDLKLIDAFFAFRQAKADSFAALNLPKPSQLVTYYASLLLSKDTAFKGFPDLAPVGMSVDSVRKVLVVLAGKASWRWTQLASLGLGLDSASIHTWTLELARSGALTPSNTAAMFPLHPLRVLVPLSIESNPVAGGDAVGLRGAFSWNPGRIIAAPKLEVRTAKGVDAAFLTSGSHWPVSGDTVWNLSNNLTIAAPASADPGIDTLVVTLSSDSGIAVTARLVFRVTPRDTTGPRLIVVSPGVDTTVGNDVVSYAVSVTATDVGSRVDSVRIRNHTHTSAPFADTIYLAVGPNAIVVQAWDAFGNRSVDTVVITRAPAPGDTTAPKVVRVSPLRDTAVAWSTKSLALSWTVTDASSLASVSMNDSLLTSASGLYQKTALLSVGINTFVLVARDAKGNAKSDTLRVTRSASPGDTTRPRISRNSPGTDTTVAWGTKSILLSWTISDDSLLSKVLLNDTALVSGTSVYQKTAHLAVGINRFVVVARDARGNQRFDSLRIVRSADTLAPVVATSPSRDTVVAFGVAKILVTATATDLNGIDSVAVGAKTKQVAPYADSVALATGPNTVVVQAWDKAGNLSTRSVVVTRARDTVAPKIVRATGAADATMNYPANTAIAWTVTDNDSVVSVSIQGQTVSGSKNVFSSTVNPGAGRNAVVVVATDRAGNRATDTVWWTTKLFDMAKNRVYPIVALPDGKVWMAADLASPICDATSCLDGEYTWSQAMGLPDSCTINTCRVDTTVRTRGICPSAWHVAGNQEWKTLIDSAGLVHLRADSGWIYNYRGVDVFNYNGDDLYGFGLAPRFGECAASGCSLAGRWWTPGSTSATASTYFRVDKEESFPTASKTKMYPVRCVHD